MPAGDDGVSEPYRVHDPIELAQKLALGRWLVLRHEHLGDVCDLGTWIEALRLACADLDVIEQALIIPRKDLTVVFNAENAPRFEQVQASIERAELDRWLERELSPEVPTRRATGK